MRALIQKVKKADVTVDGKITGSIDKGILVLLGVAPGDDEKICQWVAKKVCSLRIFCDHEDKMNLSLADAGGSLLVVSQFTLYGDCRKGKRPSFTKAATPEKGNRLYQYFIDCCRELGFKVETGIFGAMMDVSLVNDGPVTLMVEREGENSDV